VVVTPGGDGGPVLVRGADVIEETVRLLRAHPCALLCADPACYRCSRARARSR